MSLIVDGVNIAAVNYVSGGKNTALNTLKVGNTVVWQSGSSIAYWSNGTRYTDYYNYGQSCIPPRGFIPYKEGYTFVGWSTSSTSTETISSCVMGNSPITLYAVWQRTTNGSATMSYEVGCGIGVNQSGATFIGSFDATGYDKIHFPQTENSGQVFYLIMRNNTTGIVEDTVFMQIGNLKYRLATLATGSSTGDMYVVTQYPGVNCSTYQNTSNVGGDANGYTFDISSLSGIVNVYADVEMRTNSWDSSHWCGLVGSIGYDIHNATLIAGKVVG